MTVGVIPNSFRDLFLQGMLCVAAEGYQVQHDKHFPTKPFVVSPAEFVAIVEEVERENGGL